tara:strand:+ start:266 stop:481 length:216 start_codon:yes stop_codon:yes gene_type:complete
MKPQLSESSIAFLSALRRHNHFTQFNQSNPSRGLFTLEGVRYLNSEVRPHGYQQHVADQCISEITEFFRDR